MTLPDRVTSQARVGAVVVGSQRGRLVGVLFSWATTRRLQPLCYFPSLSTSSCLRAEVLELIKSRLLAIELTLCLRGRSLLAAEMGATQPTPPQADST